MRIITFSSFRQSVKPLFKQLKILSIESMSKLKLCMDAIMDKSQ